MPAADERPEDRGSGGAQEPLEVGAIAPDFELDATGKRRLRLSALLKTGPVALFFYPGNNTPG